MINKLLGTSIAAQNAAQQQAITQSYAQAVAQAQNYKSQNAMNMAQQYQAGVGRNRQREGTIVGDVFSPATSMDIEHEAYETSVSTLIDLWVARFGNEWVDLETVDDDAFFSIAYRRLKQMSQLETHYLTDRARYVCRKPK